MAKNKQVQHKSDSQLMMHSIKCYLMDKEIIAGVHGIKQGQLLDAFFKSIGLAAPLGGKRGYAIKSGYVRNLRISYSGNNVEVFK